jgi:hypothetical protein
MVEGEFSSITDLTAWRFSGGPRAPLGHDEMSAAVAAGTAG